MAIPKQQVRSIVAAVGTTTNIQGLTHCVTRLRFILKDETLVNIESLTQNELVKGTFSANGQFQVIIGPGLVDQVYDEILKDYPLTNATSTELNETANQNSNLLQRGIKTFSDVFIPILPAIVSAGLLLGLSGLLTNKGIFFASSIVEAYPNISGIADMITLIANTAFTFLPVLVGWSATKRFGGNPVLGIVLGLILINPDLMNANLIGQETPEKWTIFGLSIAKIGYQGQVLPVFVASYLLSFLEIKLKKIIPNTLQLIIVAPVVIFISSFLTFLVIGPVMLSVANFITSSIISLFDTFPIIAGFVFGFGWELLVVTGMHHAFIAVNVQLLASTNQSFLLSIIALTCVSEAAAALAVGLNSKTKKERALTYTAMTSALLGVTEPSMFGVTIKLKYPFICSLIGSGFAGMILMYFHIYAFSFGPAGPLSFIIIPQTMWVQYAFAMLVAFVIGFTSTYLIGRLKNKTIKTN